MTNAVSTGPAEPDGAPRLMGLDVLRGLAILGILFMNINDMGGSFTASFFRPQHLGWTGADRLAWFLREVFANGTTRCVLEMLFGAGMVILTDRAARFAEANYVLRRYYTRNLVLFAFGLVHLFVLLWPGDILHTYALAALVIFWFRELRPATLLAIGLSFAALQLVDGGFAYVQAGRVDAALNAARQAERTGVALDPQQVRLVRAAAAAEAATARLKASRTAAIVTEDRARTGDAQGWVGAAWHYIAALQGKGAELVFVWEAAATMLVGAALFRWGVIQGRCSRPFYRAMTLAGYAVGLWPRTVGALAEMGADNAPNIIWALDELARLATSLGHVGLVYLLLGTATGARLLRPFQAAGRTALSIYIAQTLICLWLLYPPFGLALYGTQGWAALMLTALAINAGLLLLASWWTARFAIAPVEWAWRSLAEGRRLRFKI